MNQLTDWVNSLQPPAPRASPGQLRTVDIGVSAKKTNKNTRAMLLFGGFLLHVWHPIHRHRWNTVLPILPDQFDLLCGERYAIESYLI